MLSNDLNSIFLDKQVFFALVKENIADFLSKIKYEQSEDFLVERMAGIKSALVAN